MFTFQRNDEVIVINGSEIQLNLHITIDKLETSWVAKVPSLNIISYAGHDEDIEQNANASIASFFRYWTKHQGQPAFFEHLKHLGFTLIGNQKSEAKIIPHTSVQDIAMTLAV